MGKVFNDQIIKILCAKNFNKVQNEVGEPNLKEKCSCVRRGESYVVFLDRDHRKQLQQQMGGKDFKLAATEQSLCKLGTTPASMNMSATNGGDENWLKRTLSFRCTTGGGSSNTGSLKTQICDSLSSLVPKGVMDILTPRTQRNENERITPSVFGPFLDEPVCGFIDRLFYCICMMFGMEMEAQEPCVEVRA
uniref:Flagellar L-ring protein n=1 Tax=Zeugodacus cucurbitae TaxID=28588 RepID=A0A0A1WU37_ZEUCU